MLVGLVTLSSVQVADISITHYYSYLKLPFILITLKPCYLLDPLVEFCYIIYQ